MASLCNCRSEKAQYRPAFGRNNNLSYLLIVLLLFTAGCQYSVLDDDRPNEYRAELKRINAEIKLSKQQAGTSADERGAFKHIYQLYRHASLTNDFAAYHETEVALQQTLERYGPSPQLYLFRANFNFKLHRLNAAMADLIALDRYGGLPFGEILKADIALQRGRYRIAGEAYAAICRENPSWDSLARLAYFRMHTGAPEQADRLYQQAQDKLSVKQMRHFAWLELQRGLIDFEEKRYQQALDHYLRAEWAYSGYWLIREHIAEVYALLDRRNEAIELYQTIIEQTRNPEFISALATILESDQGAEANILYRQADALFDEQYGLYPEAAVGHYIESLLKRRQADARVLDYATRNLQWRPSGRAKYLLAKAQQKLGNEVEARAVMRNILDSPWRSGDINTLAKVLRMD